MLDRAALREYRFFLKCVALPSVPQGQSDRASVEDVAALSCGVAFSVNW